MLSGHQSTGSLIETDVANLLVPFSYDAPVNGVNVVCAFCCAYRLTVPDGMIFLFKIIVLFEQLLNLVRIVIRTQPRLKRPHVVDSGRNPQIRQRIASLHGMVHKLEKRRLLRRRKTIINL